MGPLMLFYHILAAFFALCAVIFLVFAVFFLWAPLSAAPFVPSTGGQTRRMVDLAAIRPGMKVYDLGSGDGRLLWLAAQRGAVCVGYEINLILVWLTRLLFRFSPFRGQVRIRWGSLWDADLSDAQVVFVYLMPYWSGRLRRLLERRLPAGAVVVSNAFAIPGWTCLVEGCGEHGVHPVHCYLWAGRPTSPS